MYLCFFSLCLLCDDEEEDEDEGKQLNTLAVCGRGLQLLTLSAPEHLPLVISELSLALGPSEAPAGILCLFDFKFAHFTVGLFCVVGLSECYRPNRK